MHTHIRTLFCEFIIRIRPSLLKMDSSSSSSSPPVTPPVSPHACLLYSLCDPIYFQAADIPRLLKSLACGRTSFPGANHLVFHDSDAKVQDC